jgi:predicted nucleotidyltransferase
MLVIKKLKMIKLKRYTENVIERIPQLSEKLKQEKNISAMYLFGSALSGALKPLSDIDIAVLLDKLIPRDEFHEEYLNIFRIVSDLLKIDELDLVILNEAPVRITHNILKTGKLLFSKDNAQLAEFIEINFKLYPDFMFYKNQYNSEFQKQIGLQQ